jgi:hypothetical protein
MHARIAPARILLHWLKLLLRRLIQRRDARQGGVGGM